MSRIGIKPVVIPEGVTVDVKESEVEIKGKNATLNVPLLRGISVTIEDGTVVFSPSNKTKQVSSNWGTMRALVENAVIGATKNFSKDLIVEGIGYRASVEGNDLILNLGHSHPIKFPIPVDIEIKIDKNVITISGADKSRVGETAAKIKRFRKPEPYKGKGIRYSDEIIKRKAGKKAVGSEGK
ncbi:MAG: 50S ribosomal protein L6 [Parcubacteria group bacterium GW2011_GWB1_45_7]|nr:MAG: 50S ribosomal protein L6 [Parcubacteria group bacterium GW2011_GWB1_45_7]OGY58609.1 MAG: 50S ribosomal protein L6 [Candidatus Colwellbacteria bacterium RIFCSPHIGHO2_02_FULL_45_17]